MYDAVLCLIGTRIKGYNFSFKDTTHNAIKILRCLVVKLYTQNRILLKEIKEKFLEPSEIDLGIIYEVKFE